jgi:hypothetical protein
MYNLYVKIATKVESACKYMIFFSITKCTMNKMCEFEV